MLIHISPGERPPKKPKVYTADWFDWNIPTWNRILQPLKGKPNLRFLEVGSFEGRSAVWLLENVLTDESSRLYCVDTFKGSIEHQNMKDIETLYDRFVENTKEFGERVVAIKEYSHKALKSAEVLATTFDFVYVDGAHDWQNVLRDAVLGFDLLKLNGILLFDDYDSGPTSADPKTAIDWFLKCYEGKYRILSQTYQMAIQKIGE